MQQKTRPWWYDWYEPASDSRFSCCTIASRDQSIQHQMAVIDVMNVLACRESQSCFLCSRIQNLLIDDSPLLLFQHQQTISILHTVATVLIEMFYPFQANFICNPSIWAEEDTTQSSARGLSRYQEARWVLPETTMKRDMAQPYKLTLWITVFHSQLPGCFIFALPCLSEIVTTMTDEITPIINPVSSKFRISDSSIPFSPLCSG